MLHPGWLVGHGLDPSVSLPHQLRKPKERKNSLETKTCRHTQKFCAKGGGGGHQPTDNLIHTVGLSVHPGAFNKISYISFCRAEHPNKDLLGGATYAVLSVGHPWAFNDISSPFFSPPFPSFDIGEEACQPSSLGFQ